LGRGIEAWRQSAIGQDRFFRSLGTIDAFGRFYLPERPLHLVFFCLDPLFVLASFNDPRNRYCNPDDHQNHTWASDEKPNELPHG
jgi:hypothetical protein